MASKTDEVRKALEEMKSGFVGSTCNIERVLVTEGLKVLDDYADVKAAFDRIPKDDDLGYREYMKAAVRTGQQQINFIANILRSAGRIS